MVISLQFVNVFKTYRFVHIRHSRDDTYPLDGVCYYSNHFEDLVKLLGEKRERNPSKWKYFGETIKKWSYHRTEGQETSITLKNVALENLLKR